MAVLCKQLLVWKSAYLSASWFTILWLKSWLKGWIRYRVWVFSNNSWRPLTIINCLQKIFTLSIANRLFLVDSVQDMFKWSLIVGRRFNASSPALLDTNASLWILHSTREVLHIYEVRLSMHRIRRVYKTLSCACACTSLQQQALHLLSPHYITVASFRSQVDILML